MTAAVSDAGGGVRFGTRQGRWLLAATIAGSSLATLDSTVVNVALARIDEDLDAGFTALQWVVNAYTLTLASFILLGGSLGDRLGRRRVFVVGTIWFALASALCAFAPNVEVLIAARALQGVGAALLTPGSLAIISATFAADDRSRAVGVWSGLGGISTAIGPFLGGWLADLNWRLVFGINLPLAVAVVAIAQTHVPETRQSPTAEGSPIDVRGAVLVVAMLGAGSYALTEAGRLGWQPLTISLLAFAVVAGAAFVAAERRSGSPLVAVDLLADRTFAATNVVTLFVYAALGVVFFLLVLQLQLVAGWSPVAAGSSMLPVTALMLVLSGRFGALAGRIGARPLMAAGSLVTAAALVLLLRVGPEASYVVDVLPAAAVLGLGLSMVVAPLTAAVLEAAPASEAGAASGINNAVARTAGLLAVAIVPGVAGLSTLGGGDTTGFDRGYAIAMIICAGLCLIGALVAWFGVPAGRPLPAAVPAEAERIPVHCHYHCAVAAPPRHPDAVR